MAINLPSPVDMSGWAQREGQLQLGRNEDMRAQQTQDVAMGQTALAAKDKAAIPGLLAQYKSGNQGALMQIAQKDPKLAETLMGMEEAKAKQPLMNAQTEGLRASAASVRQETAMKDKMVALDSAYKGMEGLQQNLAGESSIENKKRIRDVYMKNWEKVNGAIDPNIKTLLMADDMNEDYDKSIENIKTLIGGSLSTMRTASGIKQGDSYTLAPGEVRMGPNNKPVAMGMKAQAVSDLQSGKITKEQYDQINSGMGTGAGGMKNSILTPEQNDELAYLASIGKFMPLSGMMKSEAGQKFYAEIADKSIEDRKNGGEGFNANAATTLKSLNSGELRKPRMAIENIAGHLELLDTAMGALNNNDTQTLNKIKNAFKTEFGSADVTNLNTVKTILSAEVSKMLTGNVGTEADRSEIRNLVTNASSTEQLYGAWGMIKNMMATQADTLKSVATGAGIPEKDYMKLVPKSRKVFYGDTGVEGAGDAGAASGIPKGAVPTGKTSGGKPVYQLPDGKGWIPD